MVDMYIFILFFLVPNMKKKKQKEKKGRAINTAQWHWLKWRLDSADVSGALLTNLPMAFEGLLQDLITTKLDNYGSDVFFEIQK